MFARPRKGGRVECHLCQQHCSLREGEWGLCGVRLAQGGALHTTVYGKAVAVNVDPIEKKPLFHFHPGSRSLSIATLGCNFRCQFCQNWSISQVRETLPRRPSVPPAEVVAHARESGSRTIAFTYTEPTIFFEYAYDTAVLARREGLDTVFVTNGFLTPDALATVAPVLGAANVDLKAFRAETYRRVMGGRLQPVLDCLRAMRKQGIWLEVTTLVVPGMNDSDEELTDIARFIATDLGPDVPWHVSRFHPDHDWTDGGPTPVETIRRAVRIGREAGLRHVFAGNVPGEESEHTLCHACGHRLVARSGFRILANEVREGACPRCGTPVAGVWS
jgi:pyruvate formate lyase activating enzyme